ncbi:YybH family protein [Microbacterium deminutum]|uniref:YybH family protein n=1 Tax=Microbacterium deminutum TaxID=344164 RepID=UPI0031E3C16F
MEIETFVADVVPRVMSSQSALYTGDPAPWKGLWLPGGPVSWLGQFGTCALGRSDVLAHFARVAARQWRFEGFDLDLIAADVAADHGYLITRERPRVQLEEGGPPVPTARVSRVLHREDGRWYVAHGHADLDPLALDLPWKPPANDNGEAHDH